MERQGLMGTLLRVDLTTGKMTEESAEACATLLLRAKRRIQRVLRAL